MRFFEAVSKLPLITLALLAVVSLVLAPARAEQPCPCQKWDGSEEHETLYVLTEEPGPDGCRRVGAADLDGRPVELPEKAASILACAGDFTFLTLDRRTLIFSDQGGAVRALDLRGGAVANLLTLPEGRESLSGPEFSPNGSDFALVLVGRDIFPEKTRLVLVQGPPWRVRELDVSIRLDCTDTCRVRPGLDFWFAGTNRIGYIPGEAGKEAGPEAAGFIEVGP